MEFSTFMHFNVDTSWVPPAAFWNNPPWDVNPTYHNCEPSNTGTSHDHQTQGTWPCLNASIFNPIDLDPDSWMQAVTAMGAKEICLTAKHGGGFTLWPSEYTPYGVHASMHWRDGKGDVLREFAAAARRHDVRICYYLNPLTDGYLTQVAKVNASEYERRERGMLREVLSPGSPYGPVHRLWLDGVPTNDLFRPPPLDKDYHAYYDRIFAYARSLSPQTLLTPYRGDVCSPIGSSLYTNDGPAANGTNSSECTLPNTMGKYFHPIEHHGITMQMGPDGNTDLQPTYWFWHTRGGCPPNASNPCPWVGHGNASRLFEGYLATVGRGGVLNLNSPPTANGLYEPSVVKVMKDLGTAINDTFHKSVVATPFDQDISAPCTTGIVELDVPAAAPFDYIMAMEDLSQGQRIANYSLDFQRVGSPHWETLVPPVLANNTITNAGSGSGTGSGIAHKANVRDRPDGHDPRDSFIGHKRIDIPVVDTHSIAVSRVRFNCLGLLPTVEANDAKVHLRSLSLHRKKVPWQ